tara:strand:+ start:101 stop:574 length:474 start_codon:yes stop_codon:yes gene_type:complete
MGFINLVLSPIESIFDPIVNIIKVVIQIIALLIELIKVVPKLFSLFTIFTDPGKVINDTVYGIITGIKMIFEAIFDSTLGSVSNKFKPYFLGDLKENKDEKKCLSPTYIELIILILCPPLAIFIRNGINKFFIILIASLLTYLYYFPGLIYATLYIL